VARIIAGRYELETRIGRGAMGEVWAATDRRTGAAVAVKLAQLWAISEPELVARFEQEGKLLKRLRSRYICSLVEHGRTDDDVPFIVLERLEGETLEALLEREGYLSLDEAGRILDEILQALCVAHDAGIVHRDLSPSNVFLHRGRDGHVVTKLVDFGIAKASEAGTGAPRTGNKVTMGSLSYTAPEQLGDAAKAGPRADLYAAGTIFFQALTGKLPYGDARATQLVVMKREHDPPTIDEATGEKWPAGVRTFLTKTIARTPGKRYASAEIALAALREAMRGRAPPLTMPERPIESTPTLDEPDRRRRTR
jgi:eukaryotic-like serine/threonine-protein kinase